MAHGEDAAVVVVVSPVVAPPETKIEAFGRAQAAADSQDSPPKTDRSSAEGPPVSNPQMTLAFRARLVPVSPPAGLTEARPADGEPEECKFAGTKGTAGVVKTASQPKASAEPKAKEADTAQPIRVADPAKPMPGVGVFPAEQAAAQGGQDSSGEHLGALASREPAGEPASAFTPPPPAAHAIQVQVDRGEQRVNVLLAERGGEVHVSVRTPDPQLAGALRQQLPALSSRLEQTGFQTETWHPAQWHAPERRAPASETNLSGPSAGKHGETRQGGQQQPQPEPRQSKPNGTRPGTVTSRKEFQWLMSQLP